MTSLKEENPDLYAKQFSRFVKAGVEPTSVEFFRKICFISYWFVFSSKLYIKLHMPLFVLIHHHHLRKKRRLMHLKQNGK
jgi:hypothetical protein